MRTLNDLRREYRDIRNKAVQIAGNLTPVQFDEEARKAIENIEMDFSPPSWVAAAESVLMDVEYRDIAEAEQRLLWNQEKSV